MLLSLTLPGTSMGAAGAIGAGAVGGGAANEVGEIEFNDCELNGSQGFGMVTATCTELVRPVNPAEPNGAVLKLKVAVIHSLSPDPQPDAFTVINGGPGGSSIEFYVDGVNAFQSILRERDIVVVDQRGTGASNPLDCPELEALSDSFDEGEYARATDNCLAQLPSDPRFFTTSIAVQDLEAVREALGYSQLNIYGVSYGTRVAQHYLRRYPGSVRTLIIDGVVPHDLALGPNAAINAQRTLDRLFARCAATPQCHETYPDLAESFQRLRRRLLETPVTVDLAHPVTGKQETLELTYPHLLVTIRLLSYQSETVSLIPLIIDQAERLENYLPIASNALQILDSLSSAMRFGMHNAVICAEDIPFLGTINTAELQATYMGGEQVAALQAICSRWPHGLIDEDFRQPLNSNVPTLLLSGEEDPITPPFYGDQVAEVLPNSLHLVAAGQGHGVFARGCVPRLIAEFIQAGELEPLDVSCVSKMAAAPFFINLLGPAP